MWLATPWAAAIPWVAAILWAAAIPGLVWPSQLEAIPWDVAIPWDFALPWNVAIPLGVAIPQVRPSPRLRPARGLRPSHELCGHHSLRRSNWMLPPHGMLSSHGMLSPHGWRPSSRLRPTHGLYCGDIEAIPMNVAIPWDASIQWDAARHAICSGDPSRSSQPAGFERPPCAEDRKRLDQLESAANRLDVRPAPLGSSVRAGRAAWASRPGSVIGMGGLYREARGGGSSGQISRRLVCWVAQKRQEKGVSGNYFTQLPVAEVIGLHPYGFGRPDVPQIPDFSLNRETQREMFVFTHPPTHPLVPGGQQS